MSNETYLLAILPALKAPMPYQWRVQSFSKHKPEATCVAYIDARDAMDRLDQVCSYGWQRRHVEMKNHIYCEVGIVMPDGSVQWRMDCGTESQTEAEKGEASDSFKRACVNWGIGRFLYDLEIKRLPANEIKSATNWPYIVDSHGKRVWDLTKHINSGARNTQNPAIAEANQLFESAIKAIENANTMDELQKHFGAACGLITNEAEKARVVSAKDARKSALLEMANGR